MPTPEFVLHLRAKVGHDPLWLAGACAVVLRQNGHGPEVLLVRRSDDGRWTPVGGIVDPGEHPADTAEREVLEETGVRCVVEGLASVTVGPVATYPNGDLVQFLTHTFRCRALDGEPHPADDESDEVGWFALDALPALSPHFHGRIAAALAYDGTTQLPRDPESHVEGRPGRDPQG